MKSKPLYADLTQRIEIREASNDPNNTQGVIETTYNVKATVWGAVRPLSVSHQIGAFIRDSQVENQPTHIVRLRVNEELGVTRSGLQGNMYLFIKDTEKKGRSFCVLSSIDKGDRGVELAVIVREMGIQFGTDQLS